VIDLVSDENRVGKFRQQRLLRGLKRARRVEHQHDKLGFADFVPAAFDRGAFNGIVSASDPGVSSSMIARPLTLAISPTQSRVVPGRSAVMDRS